jgi:phosphatidylserine decarboxylase
MKIPFKAAVQYVIPHHFLSRIVHRMMRTRYFPFRRPLVNWLIRLYNINVDEAIEPDLHNREVYPDLNSAFTRALKPGIRPVSDDPGHICSPADGTISQIGKIDNDRIFQAKGHNFSLLELLGGDKEYAKVFRNGNFITTYLSPRDYHRVHMPISGTLKKMIHIPGRLFSVAPVSIKHIPRLFARNERVVSLFETELGPVAVILVGAIFVGSIETVWAGEVTPPHGKEIRSWDYKKGKNEVSLARAEEMGRFNLGSTVILLFPENKMDWLPELISNDSVLMGQTLGMIRPE